MPKKEVVGPVFLGERKFTYITPGKFDQPLHCFKINLYIHILIKKRELQLKGVSEVKTQVTLAGMGQTRVHLLLIATIMLQNI